jgi:hypothetical protein
VLQLFQVRDQRYRNRNLRGELAGAVSLGSLETQVVAGATQNWRFQNGRENRTTPCHQLWRAPSRRTSSPARHRPAAGGSPCAPHR